MDKKDIRVVVVEDESLARDYVRRLLDDDGHAEIVAEATNGKDGLAAISEQMPDVVFLDVQMPEMDGFGLLKKLPETDRPVIVFTTAFKEYAVDAFEFHAVDYLLKPFDRERFEKAVARARLILESDQRRLENSRQITKLAGSSERIPVRQNGKVVFIEKADIDYIRADDKYVHICSANGNYMVRQTLAAMRAQLNAETFVQTHRSFIVNTKKIRELHQEFNGRYSIQLKSGAEVPLSRGHKDELFEVLGRPL